LGSWVFELAFVLCGFAASRAESLRLSVKTPNLLGGYAARAAASKTSCEATESRSLSAREAAKPHNQFKTKVQKARPKS
jgi:hypothetical protein